ncbi:hypothetical protein [Corynebacterium pyruviciproducens]
MRRRLATVAVLTALTLPVTPAMAQQLPSGVSVQDVQNAISQPISVPAGQTITVDLGIPVQAGYSGDGWQVSTSGTQVTVTAPAEGGSTIAVPAQAAGMSATITLVSSPQAAAPTQAEVPATGDEAESSDGAPSSGVAPASGTSDAHPERTPASPVTETDARRIDLTAHISGNTMTAQLGVLEAAKLYSEFSSVDREGLTLRYMDSEGRIIEGVKRNVDKENLKLTLTYPEGETPDNPFIIQVVRDGTEAISIVTLTAPASESGGEAGDTTTTGDEETASGEEHGGLGWIIGIAAVALVGVLVLLAVLLTVGRRKN